MTDAQKAQLSIDEALELMRNKPVNSTLVERWQLISQVLDRYANLPQPLFLGHGLNYIVEHASLPTKEHDLLLGRFDDHIPSDEEEEFLRQMEERNAREQFTVDGGHLTLNWETIFARGLTGLKADADAERQRQSGAGAPKEKLIYLESMSLVYSAYIRFAERYADAAGGLSCEARQRDRRNRRRHIELKKAAVDGQDHDERQHPDEQRTEQRHSPERNALQQTDIFNR